MGPGLGKIFPRVGARIGGDKMPRPVRGWSVCVIVFQRGIVIAPLVAEHAAKTLDMRRVCYQPNPIIMADFVPEMAKWRAIKLAHLLPPALALRIVGLGNVDG